MEGSVAAARRSLGLRLLLDVDDDESLLCVVRRSSAGMDAMVVAMVVSLQC